MVLEHSHWTKKFFKFNLSFTHIFYLAHFSLSLVLEFFFLLYLTICFFTNSAKPHTWLLTLPSPSFSASCPSPGFPHHQSLLDPALSQTLASFKNWACWHRSCWVLNTPCRILVELWPQKEKRLGMAELMLSRRGSGNGGSCVTGPFFGSEGEFAKWNSLHLVKIRCQLAVVHLFLIPIVSITVGFECRVVVQYRLLP